MINKLVEIFFPYRSKIKDIHSPSLIIEISGGCIAKCPFCPSRGSFVNNKNFLEPAHLDKIIIHLKKQKLLNDGAVLQLYNYGEPFIHPQINEIIAVAAKNTHSVGFSSNFIKLPDLKAESYKSVNFIVFSLCGLSEETYRPIYGADIKSVLSNFNSFLEKKDKYNPNINVAINWIKYKDSENEFEKAKKYFAELNCEFRPITAFLNDRDKMIKFMKNELTEEETHFIRSKLDVDACLKKMEYFKKDTTYECPHINSALVIDESGNLLGCSESSQGMRLGNILSMNRSEILIRKVKYSKTKNCRTCREIGLSKFICQGLVD